MKEGLLEKGSKEFMKLQIVATQLTLLSKHGRNYMVEDVYRDFGQGLMWTTISYNGECGGVQVLSPREWRAIMNAESLEELSECVKEIRNGEYFND